MCYFCKEKNGNNANVLQKKKKRNVGTQVYENFESIMNTTNKQNNPTATVISFEIFFCLKI